MTVFCGSRLDPQSGQIGNSPEHLTRRERDIALILLRHAGQFVQHESIYGAIYAAEANPPNDHVVSVHISNIRTKFHRAGVAARIESSYGLGWRLIDDSDRTG